MEITKEKILSQHARDILESSLALLVTISIDGVITDVNEAFVKIIGISREKLIDTEFVNYLTEPQKVAEYYQEVFKKDLAIDYPLTIKHANGNLVDLLFNASIFKDIKGKILGIFAVARDVTKQKRLELDLERSLKEMWGYKYALDEASIVAITDQKGIIKYANDNFCKISKYTREELIGQDHRIVNSGRHSKEFMQDLWMTITSGKKWRGDIQNRAKDGSLYWVDTTIVPFLNENGVTDQYIAVRIDITAQKLLSQYSRSLIEASPDPFITISLDGKITDMNEALVGITGVERQSLMGTDFGDYFTDPDKAREVYKEVFSKGFVKDYPLVIIDGKLTDVLFNGSVYKDEQGKVLGAVVVARVITEQKRVEKELIEAKVFAELATMLAEEAKIKAEEAMKSKQQFLSNMSHEIRTPMNAIIGFTRIMLKTELTAKQKEYLMAIKMSGDSLIVLINDILDLAKVDAGKMTFEQTPFKLSQSISAMLHLFETKIQEKNLELFSEYDNRIPEVVLGDPVRLHQIILNLMSNAVKFTAKGRISMIVRMLEEDDESVTIEFAVTDTGIGITENKLEKIFENFQQAANSTSRLYGGTGLGLAIAKQLVEPQGGTIAVKSTIGEGSTFSFVLTFKKTDAEASLETEIIELDADIKNIKVLVVEDMALNQLLMKTVLDDFGFERDVADNGKIAIEKLRTKSYDIILMDLQMPEMNGFETTEYIRNILNSKIPIIALTADVTTVDVVKCKSVGMNDYIAKPVDERLLYSKIIGLVKKTNISDTHKHGLLNQGEQVRYTNLNYLSQRTKSNPQLMMEMISAYLEQTPPLINAMKKSFESKDWAQLHSVVHKMIPSFSIMGMSLDFESMARKIQEFSRTQQQLDSITDMVLHLEKVCSQACLELTEEYNTIKNIRYEKL